MNNKKNIRHNAALKAWATRRKTAMCETKPKAAPAHDHICSQSKNNTVADTRHNAAVKAWETRHLNKMRDDKSAVRKAAAKKAWKTRRKQIANAW